MYESDNLDIFGGSRRTVIGVAIVLVVLLIALIIYIVISGNSSECADGNERVGEKCLVKCADGEGRVGETCIVNCADGEVRVGVECKSASGTEFVVPKTYTIDMCPEGYRTNKINGSRCSSGASVGFGEKEAKEVCDNAGHTWIPLDYMKNPYTCDIAS